jgi:hypothetical protein
LKKGLRLDGTSRKNTTLLMNVFQEMIDRATGLARCCRFCPAEASAEDVGGDQHLDEDYDGVSTTEEWSGDGGGECT